MKKKRILVDIQETNIIRGNSHNYDEYVNRTNRDYTQSDNSIGPEREHRLANPDQLPCSTDTSPSSPQLLMGEAIGHLQGRQKETYLLTMREGKSLSEVGEILGISKAAAQIYKVRAIKFIEMYCREAIAKGRV